MPRSISVGMKNSLRMSRRKKRLVHPFIRQELWKCIGCIISAVTYVKTQHKLWSEKQILMVIINQKNYKHMFVVLQI